MSTPTWQGATNGQPPLANQVNQFLGAHASTEVYTGVEKDNQSTAGTGATNSNSTWIAQKFTAASSYTSGRVVLTLAVTGSPAPWVVSIQADSTGAPSGTALASVTLPNGFVPGTAGTVSLPLSTTITSGSTYWIVAQAVGDVSNLYAWSKSNQVSGTSTSTNGTVWTTQAYGSLFQVWDSTTLAPLVHLWEDSGARWTTLSYATNGELTGLNEYTTAQGGSYTQSVATVTYSGALPTSVTQSAVTNVTATWSAPRSGLLGDPGSVNASSQLNQLLGTHRDTIIYQGNKILTPEGTGGGFSGSQFNANDKSQPFTMSGTSIGRVQIPVIAFGDGADLIVSLCADNAGVPGTVITQTRVPAAWFTTLGKYGAVLNTSPVQLTPTGSPLATASFNTFTMGNVATFNYTSGTPSGGGYGTIGPSVVNDGETTVVIIGGQNSANNYVTNVWSITYDGTNALANMVPQPSLPTGLGAYSACTITTDPSSGAQYVIATGGATGNSGSYTTIANVYASQLTGGTGQMSAWSTQTSLPQPMQTATATSSGNYVYIIGGITPSNTVLNTVYWANVQNGQITGWNSGPPLPVGVYNAYTVCVNGFIFVIGGYTQPSNVNPTSAAWYAAINSDGSLGPWQSGPTMPFNNIAWDLGGSFMTASSDGLIVRGGPVANGGTPGLFSLAVDVNGPAPSWQIENFGGFGFDALFANGSGQYYWFENFVYANTSYISSGFILCPYVSVPLPATGLTNGATYHIMMQQPTGAIDLNNTLGNVFDFNTFPGNPTEVFRARGSATWNTTTVAIPITIYDQSSSGTPIHTWEDNGTRISTYVFATTPDARPLGVLEATQQPAPILNMNPSFTTGTAPWNATGGTLTQSNAQTRGGLPFSGLLTPSGVATQSFIECEHITVELNQQYVCTAWFYSPTGYSNVGISVNWFNSSGTYLSTTSGGATSIPAGVWTKFQTTVTANVANAVALDMVCIEGGTPPASALLYVWMATVQSTVGPMLSSVTEQQWAGTWPNANCAVPTGTTQLA